MMRISVGVLTVSDKASRGEREDRSYRAIAETLDGFKDEAVRFEIAWYGIVPDERDQIAALLRELADVRGLDLVLTTGGTGLSPRDVTPEATMDVVERVVPGIPEAMRTESLKKTPAGMLSRSVCGIRGNTLIINLPGSPKGARECLEAVIVALPHAIEVLRGEVGDHEAP
jgi:molybdenum cofactor synthesis domain-containing protein